MGASGEEAQAGGESSREPAQGGEQSESETQATNENPVAERGAESSRGATDTETESVIEQAGSDAQSAGGSEEAVGAASSASGVNDHESTVVPNDSEELLSEEDIEDDDAGSEYSDMSEVAGAQVTADDVYPLESIVKFLDDTFGQPVDVREFFPDLRKFELSVVHWKKTAGNKQLCKKKKYRLKNHLTKIRKIRKLPALAK